jgi:hypothetical protein
MAGRLTPRPLGPFPGGVLDRANAVLSAVTAGKLKRARGVVYSGGGRLAARNGDRVLLTLKDDQGTPATVTAVLGVWQFADRALAVAHSTVTNKVYIYVLAATMDGWYNAVGALQATTSPQPVGALWTSVTTVPDVTVTEGLGVAYIAHTDGASSAALSFAMKSLTLPGTIATVTSDLDSSAGAEDLYALGCIAFQQHLWIWGVGSGTTPANHYRPELARFCQPNFTLPFSPADSITLGDRVRSDREKIVGGAVAGGALYLGSAAALTRVTGYGRTSWFKEPLDKSFGFPGPKCMTVRKDTLYWWSSRGPMRCDPGSRPEPLWLAIEGAVATVINVSKVVASYDEGNDIVLFAYDGGSGVRTLAMYDCTREVWLGPDDDLGLAIRNAGSVAPVYSSSATTVTAPSAAPTSAVTSGVGSTAVTASWTTGDASAQTQVEYRRQGDTTWTIAALVAAGVASYQITSLTAAVAYEWRAAHYKGGSYSSYLGPSASTQFTTSAVSTGLLPPSNLSLSVVANNPGSSTIRATWTNSGESGVSTNVETRDATHGGLFASEGSVSAPTSSLEFDVFVSGTYEAQANHTKPSYADSDYTAVASIAVTVDGLDVT